VLAPLGEAVWSELVVDLVKCGINGTVVCAHDDGTVICVLNDGMVRCVLDDALCLLFFLNVEFIDMVGTVEVSAVAGDMT
jgi:hypothetical protein